MWHLAPLKPCDRNVAGVGQWWRGAAPFQLRRAPQWLCGWACFQLGEGR